MKTKTPLILALAAFAGFSVLAQTAKPYDWVAPSRAAKKPNPVASTPDSLAKGKAFYTRECASCHGPSGRGDGPKAGTLAQKPRDLSDPGIQGQSDGSIFWKLTEGKSPMPTYAKSSEDERWSVINYVRTLKR